MFAACTALIYRQPLNETTIRAQFIAATDLPFATKLDYFSFTHITPRTAVDKSGAAFAHAKAVTLLAIRCCALLAALLFLKNIACQPPEQFKRTANCCTIFYAKQNLNHANRVFIFLSLPALRRPLLYQTVRSKIYFRYQVATCVPDSKMQNLLPPTGGKPCL